MTTGTAVLVVGGVLAVGGAYLVMRPKGVMAVAAAPKAKGNALATAAATPGIDPGVATAITVGGAVLAAAPGLIDSISGLFDA